MVESKYGPQGTIKNESIVRVANEEPKAKRHPEWKLQKGGVSIAAWPNEAQGRKYLTYTLQRSYKNKEDQWVNTQSFRASDLPVLALLIANAYMKEEEAES